MLFSFFFPQIGAEVTNRNMQHFLLWIYDSTNHIHLRNNWVPLSFLWLSAVISCCQVPQGSGNDLWLGARQRAVEMLHGHWAQATYRCTPRVMCEKNTYKAISTWNWERLSQAEEEDWNIAIQQQTLLPDVAMYSHQSKLWPKCSCHGTVCGTAWHTLIDLIDIFYVLVLSALVKFPLNQLDVPASWFWKAIWLPGAKALKKRTNSRSKFRCAPAAALQVGTRDFSRCWGFFFATKNDVRMPQLCRQLLLPASWKWGLFGWGNQRPACLAELCSGTVGLFRVLYILHEICLTKMIQKLGFSMFKAWSLVIEHWHCGSQVIPFLSQFLGLIVHS